MSLEYFVSYHLTMKAGGFCFGCCNAEADRPISTMDDILQMADDIQTKIPGCDTLVILNWQPFEPPVPITQEQKSEPH